MCVCACVLCPVRMGSPKLILCFMCNNWCHVPCSYQIHLGRVCPCHIRILDPKKKIMYMEDYVVLPTRPVIRAENRLAGKDINYKLSWDDRIASRWCSATWINVLVEKHAWLSAGLIWMPDTSDTCKKVEHNDPQSAEPQPLPTINNFELCEDGSQQAKAVSSRDFHYPMCFALLSMELLQQGHIAKRCCGGSCEQLRVCSQIVWSCEQLIESRNPLPEPTKPFKGIH